jgi:putative phosphoesterase
MKVGVISDVHSNKVALDAVLEDMPAVDALVCAGDVVGYNPWPAECVEAVRERDVPTVMGNHDRMVAHDTNFGANAMAQAGVRLAHDQLSDEQIEWIRGLPEEQVLFDGRLKVVHGHPSNPDRYTYPAEYHAGMLGDEDALVMGHTHVQGHETYREGVVLNPGSVGQPRDRDPRAAYAVLDLDELDVAEHRVEYDVDRVVEATREAELPRNTGERLRKGR